MGLADTINQGPQRKSGCHFSVFIGTLDKKDVEAIESAIEKIRTREVGYSIGWLHRVLLSEGNRISASTIQRHVNGECACGPK